MIKQINRLFVASFAIITLLLAGPAHAQTQIINNSGGNCAFNGETGGLRIHTSGNSQFQVERCSANGSNSRARQFFSSGQLPPSNFLFNSMYLRVGDEVFGSGNQAAGGGPDIPGLRLFRTVSASGGSTLGDGASVAVYAADLNGLTYTVTQTVSYILSLIHI